MLEILAMLVFGIGYGLEQRQKYESHKDFDYQSERNSLLSGSLYWTDHKGRSWINGSLKPQEVRVIPYRTGLNQTELIAVDAHDYSKKVLNITREQYYNQSIRNKIEATKIGCGTYELIDKDLSQNYVPFRVEISTGERVRLELSGYYLKNKYGGKTSRFTYKCYKKYYKNQNSDDFSDEKNGEFVDNPWGRSERISLNEYAELGGFIQSMPINYIMSPRFIVNGMLCRNGILSKDELHVDEEKLKAYTDLVENEG